MDSKQMNKDKEFIGCIKEYVKYWEHQEDTLERKLNGLAFSILAILDGVAGSFDGSRDDLSKNVMLHDLYYEKEKNNDEI